MKKVFGYSSLSLFCAIVLVISSCANFLSGGEFKEQLESDIDRANETPFTVNIILANPMHGQLNVTSQSLKKGDSFEVKFTVANGFAFEEWTCTDSSAVRIENPKSATTKITAIKSSNQISGSPIITPACKEIFVIKSVTPENKDGGVPRDSSILITFSDKVDFSTAKEKIKIVSSEGIDLSSHYSEPILINNGYTMKFAAIRENPVITSGTALITIKADEGIKSESGEELSNFSDYTFKINSTHDNDSPLFVDFRVAKTKESLGLESGQEQNLVSTSASYEESEDFHIKDFVWIYCMAEDKGSGAYYLTANGKIIPPTYMNTTDTQTENFISTSENIYEFGPYKLEFPADEYSDGKIDIEFKLYDYCDNECPDTKSYSFIRDTQIEQQYVYLYNEFPNPTTWFYPYATFYAQYDESSGYNTNYYSKCGFNGGRPYYDCDDFSSFYKKIYIDGLSDDNWLSQTSAITEKNNVSIYYTVSGVEYLAEYVEESEYTKYFVLDKTDETADTLVRAVVKDTVGNEKEITAYLPAGGITVNYGVSSSSVIPVSTKSSLENADAVEFMYFYEFEWTDENEADFNSKKTSTLSTINDLVSNNSNSTWISKIDVDGWKDGIAKKLMSLCNIEKNTKYIADFYTALNLDSISRNLWGYGPSLGGTTVLTHIKFPYDSVPYSDTDGNIGSYLNLSAAYLGSVANITCYAVPRYKYTDINTHYLYGAPIKEKVTLGSLSYSDSYAVDFDTTDVVSCGANSETCKTTIENISITDSEGNECSDLFDLKYYYESSGTTYSFYNPTITFPSALVDGKTYTVGAIATLKSDSTVTAKGSKEITLPVIDNYAPAPNVNSYYYYHTYNLFDYDKTGKEYYIDLQWFNCEYKYGTKTYSDINYLFKDRGSDALRVETGAHDYEYYWIEYDPNSMSSELPTLKTDSEGNELFSYIRKGKSTFDWIYPLDTERNKNYKMWVPVYDMDDGHYVLAIKLTDSNGNYLLKAVTYHDVETYKNLPEITLSGTTLTMKQTFGDQLYPTERNYWSDYRRNFIAGIQYFDNTEGWKDINLNLYLSDSNYSSYTTTKSGVNVSAASGKFLKCGIQAYKGDYGCYDQEREGRYSRGDYSSERNSIDVFNGDINSYPVYKYVGTNTGSYHNLLDANGGITVFCDAPAFVHTLYSIREEGYGNDINEWERRARELNPKQISSSSNYNVPISSLPEDAKSYVVVAHFADGSSAISNVHKK